MKGHGSGLWTLPGTSVLSPSESRGDAVLKWLAEEFSAAAVDWQKIDPSGLDVLDNEPRSVLPDRPGVQRVLRYRLAVDEDTAVQLGALPTEEIFERWSAGHCRLGPWAAEALATFSPKPVGCVPVQAAQWLRPDVLCVPVSTPTLPPATHTNALRLGRGKSLWVEPASADEDEIERLVAVELEARGRGERAMAIMLTHHHHDHVGGARALAERLGLPLWAHGETADRLPHLKFERLLMDGEKITLGAASGEAAWQVVHTPGHAPGHLCLFEPTSGSLVAGDMVAGHGTILVEPGDGDMTKYLASLQRMASMDPRLLIPAHGDCVDDAVGKLLGYVAHRLEREAKVMTAVEAVGRGATVSELVEHAYADTPQEVWPLAALSLQAHLLKLETDGRVRRDGELWVEAKTNPA